MSSNKINKWITITFCFYLLLFVVGCAGPSLREQSIIKGLPEEYRNHTAGFILSPTKNDIDHAISLGKKSATNDSLTYAYIIKGPPNIWSGTVYVRIASPLYLISEHAREQTRNYNEIDPTFIEYCKELDAVKITLIEQFTGGDWKTYPFKRQAILLRDGKRINPLTSIKSFNGFNPYMMQQNKELQNVMSSIPKITPDQSFTMTPEQIDDLEKTYRSMGYSEAQIRTYIHGAKATMRIINSTNPENRSSEIPLFESDAVYKASELIKPGHYEIVFRTPPTNNLIVSGDKEIKFPISFDKYR